MKTFLIWRQGVWYVKNKIIGDRKFQIFRTGEGLGDVAGRRKHY